MQFFLHGTTGISKALYGYEDSSRMDDEKEKYFFSIVDCVRGLTNQPDVAHTHNYWKILKLRLLEEENETVTNCNALKM